MKKILTIFLSILLIALVTLISTSHANMFNRFKKGFYFEKYSTAEEARTELLKLHPIGSDVGRLIKTLERMGAVRDKFFTRDDTKIDEDKERYFFRSIPELVEPNHYKYKSVKVSDSTHAIVIYDYNYGIVNPILWKISVWYDNKENITEIDLGKNYMGL